MEDDFELEYSTDALGVRDLFYSEYNDVNIFVEDVNKEYIYENILKRLLGDEYHINSIFPCGGKPYVIEQFYRIGEETNGVKNIFIVDGDFDRLINKETMVNNNHFIYLKAYNIENYYIDENATISYVKQYIHKLDDELVAIIKFDEWKSKIVNQATKLFLRYCFVKKYNCSVKTLDRPLGLFLDKTTGFEREDGAFDDYNQEIIDYGLEVNMEDEIKRIDDNYKSIYGNDYFYLICGKFLIKSLTWYLINILKSVNGKNTNFNENQFIYWLSYHFDISTLNYLKDAIIR